MTKQEKIYRIFMTSMIVIIAGLLLATGIIAIQKSIRVKMGIQFLPGVNVEIYVKNDTYTEYELLFRNYVIDEENGIFANTDYCVLSTGTLQLNDTFFERYENNFTLKIYNNSGFDILTTITGRATANVEGGVIEGVEPEITPNEASIYNKSSEEFVVTCEPLLSQETILEIVMVKEAAWDGTVATQFAGGTGTENDPFLISNGSELAYLGDTIGRAYDDAVRNKYFKLTKNIKLNDEKFTNLGNGFVEVTDGVNVGYIGDGSQGSTRGTWYSKSGDTYTALETQPTLTQTDGLYYGTILYGENGILNVWYPISNNTGQIVYHSYHCFASSFDGDGYEIVGLYKNEAAEGDTLYGGLFGGISGGIIKNLGFSNSFIVSTGGSLVGYCGSAFGARIENCYNSESVTVYGTGGLAGETYAVEFINCYNLGVLVDGCGGICYVMNNGVGTGFPIGSGNNIFYSRMVNCYNEADIICEVAWDVVGGLVAITQNSVTYEGEVFVPSLYNCYNIGTISSGLGAAGLVGHAYAINMVNCYNLGRVESISNAGGLIGGITLGDSNKISITNSYNSGPITGNVRYTGEICGRVNGSDSSVLSIVDVYYYKYNTVKAFGKYSDGESLCTPLTSSEVTTLTAKLNTWVSANNSEGIYSNWTTKSDVNNGLPIFDWQ